MNTKKTGHMAAFLTIVIWATTFISTKILLKGFQPIEILLIRFVIGYLVLLLVYPRRLHVKEKKHEIYFIFAGLSGICIYYLLENVALTYTQASNVGVIVSISPFFIAILSITLLKEKVEQKVRFFIGFILAMLGICLISFEGQTLQFNPFGDFLALVAAFVWAIYSLIGRKIAALGYSVLQTTRRTFFYGILFMLPVLCLHEHNWNCENLLQPCYLLNILYLGVGASALCFVTWNYAVKQLGPVKTSIYIYLVPVITMLASVIILHEKMTWFSIIGVVLTVMGLFVSRGRQKV